MEKERKPRVLVVDDESAWRGVYTRVLKPLGVEVVSASNVEEALKTLETEGPFTHIISDGLKEGWRRIANNRGGAFLIVISGDKDLGPAVEESGGHFESKGRLTPELIRNLINH